MSENIETVSFTVRSGDSKRSAAAGTKSATKMQVQRTTKRDYNAEKICRASGAQWHWALGRILGLLSLSSAKNL
jgi:hypothetical protein